MKVIISGITGQDGSYLAELLLQKGYEVHGIIRRSSSFNTGRIDHIINNKEYRDQFFFHHGDVTDTSNLNRILEKVKPDEIYNLAAQSHVKVSFDLPDYTAQVDALGTLRFLDAIRETGVETKFYQASTSELYGYWIIINYREAYNLFACNGILFNHESPRRGETFVTRKITRAAARIKAGIQDNLYLGNLNAKRDWGYAPEYVEGMWRMLQQDKPRDYVLATGETNSVKDFVDIAFKELNLDLEWEGEGLNEKGIEKNTGKERVLIDPDYYRPTEVEILKGDASKAKKELGWSPKVKFEELVSIMVKADYDKINKDA